MYRQCSYYWPLSLSLDASGGTALWGWLWGGGLDGAERIELRNMDASPGSVIEDRGMKNDTHDHDIDHR